MKLADIGDVLLTTSALRRLRQAYPQARLDYLTTANGALALRHSSLVDETILFDKFGFDRLSDALRPSALAQVAAFGRQLRARRYESVLVFHHFTTVWGAAKFNALLLASGAPVRVGLDNGRGLALTHRVPDQGFGVRHEAEYALAVAQAALPEALAATPVDPHLDFPIPPAAHAAAVRLLAPLGNREYGIGNREYGIRNTHYEVRNTDYALRSTLHGHRVALFPGSGGYSLARRWPPALFAQVADALQRRGVQVVLVGRSGDNTGAVVQAMQTRPALDLTDQGDLATLGAVLQQMDLLLTNDGGPMHIAAAVGTPVVAVFGLSNDRAYGPWDGAPPRLWPPRLDAPPTPSRHTVVKLDLGCQPCFYRGYRLGAPGGCATRECLTMLAPSLVIKAVLQRLMTKD